MKMNQKKSQFETDIKPQETRSFVIKQNAHTFKILSDSLYSDKPLAVVRELSCNAWDAHIMAGNEKEPFFIHLPNKYEPFFSIRDFGTGLSEDGIYDLYCTYGGTTKDETNEVTGGFGLGSKSPFAYTDQFTVTSYFEGKKMMFNAYIGEQGSPEIIKTHEEDTTEANGLEVYIPVEQPDFYAFEARARKVLCRFPVMPLVDGVEEFKLEPIKYLIETDNFKLRRERYGDAVAIQGLVAYPIRVNSMQAEPSVLQAQVLNAAIDLQFDIGEVAITAPREQLNYDKDTEKAILAKADQVLRELPVLVQDKIDKCKTLWEAKLTYVEWFSESTLPNELKKHIGETLKFKKKPLASDRVNFAFFKERIEDEKHPITGATEKVHYEDSYAELHGYEKSIFKMKRISANVRYKGSMVASVDQVFIYDDVGARQNNAKLEYHFKHSGKNVSLIKCEKTKLRSVKAQLGNPPIRNWSEYCEPPKEYTESFQKARVVRKLLKLNLRRGDWEDTDHDVALGGLYIMTYSREAQLKHRTKGSLTYLVGAARTLGFIDEDTPVFGIQSTFKKIPETHDGWENVEEFVKAKLEAYLKTINFPKLVANYEELEFLRQHFSRLDTAAEQLDGVKLRNSRSLMGKIVKARSLMSQKEIKVDVLMRLCAHFDVSYRRVKPEAPLAKMIEESRAKYPMLELTGYGINPGVLLHYVEVCDASPSIKLKLKEKEIKND